MKMKKELKVLQTKKYKDFKLINSNRDIDLNHVKKLVSSMNKKLLFSPIIVNENMEIVDGQHRYMALKELKLPVQYIVVDGYNKHDVVLYNINQKNWGLFDYYKHHLSNKRYEYQVLENFINEYGLSFKIGCLIAVKKTRTHVESFKNGSWKFDNYNKICNFVKFYLKIKNYWGFSGQRNFINALVAIWSNANFEEKRFFENVSRYNNIVEQRAKADDYLLLFETLYNYNRVKKKELFDRFSPSNKKYFTF